MLIQSISSLHKRDMERKAETGAHKDAPRRFTQHVPPLSRSFYFGRKFTSPLDSSQKKSDVFLFLHF